MRTLVAVSEGDLAPSGLLRKVHDPPLRKEALVARVSLHELKIMTAAVLYLGENSEGGGRDLGHYLRLVAEAPEHGSVLA